MRLFAVRTVEGQAPVGFFWVRDLFDLLRAVDDICDPSECEYKSIRKRAGLVWEHSEEWQMGVETPYVDPPTEEAELRRVKDGMDFYMALDDFTGGTDVKHWKPLDALPPEPTTVPIPVPDGFG
jgi:hypothetical protein